MTHNGSKKCNFWWLEWNNYFVKKKKVWPILIKLFQSLTISWAANEWMLWRKRDSLTNDIWINKRGLFLLWKSFYEFQFLLILMSNYDHIWNIIQMFSFYERFFFWFCGLYVLPPLTGCCCCCCSRLSLSQKWHIWLSLNSCWKSLFLLNEMKIPKFESHW